MIGVLCKRIVMNCRMLLPISFLRREIMKSNVKLIVVVLMSAFVMLSAGCRAQDDGLTVNILSWDENGLKIGNIEKKPSDTTFSTNNKTLNNSGTQFGDRSEKMERSRVADNKDTREKNLEGKIVDNLTSVAKATIKAVGKDPNSAPAVTEVSRGFGAMLKEKLLGISSEE